MIRFPIHILTIAAALSLATGSLQAEETAKPVKAAIGEKAPDFSLSDTDGKVHRLKDLSGRIVVLEWFNANCPYSGADSKMGIYATAKAKNLQSELRKIDPSITYLLIDSTARGKTEKQLTDIAKKAKADWKISAPILIDYDGDVGHAYEAQKTPHMFVIDAEGILRYEGAFDDDKTHRNTDSSKTTNYVLNAVKQIKAGEKVAPNKKRPWGCGVKYAAAQ